MLRSRLIHSPNLSIIQGTTLDLDLVHARVSQSRERHAGREKEEEMDALTGPVFVQRKMPPPRTCLPLFTPSLVSRCWDPQLGRYASADWEHCVAVALLSPGPSPGVPGIGKGA
jgi:hypothetical protein